MWYRPGFLDAVEADAALARCLALDWDQEHITLFGKTHPVPRLSSWHGDPGTAYRYANITMEPKPWVPVLTEIRDRIDRELTSDTAHSDTALSDTAHSDTAHSDTAFKIDTTFNSVLANRYRHGGDRAAWHADDEPELGPNPIIASVSLGATRRFRFRPKDPEKRQAGSTVSLDLKHGSLVVMAGATQANYHHEITKTARPVAERINLTFRTIQTVLHEKG